ncbi:MAG TPA: uridine phosphorylase, partial [Lachnoclostridium sp.]|nr:uridine phosphorylase [Lachnoclostridium sp.]
MEKLKMMHIGISKGDVGRYVFLPGSPERAEKIAAHFDNPREIAYNREFRTFVGELDGTRVAVTSTGIGGPSAAIAVEELYQCGADTMLRIGSGASTSEKVKTGDIVIPNGAIRMEGVSNHYLPVEFPAVPDFSMIKELEAASQRLNMPYNVGVTITKASFYSQTQPEKKPV